MREQSVCMYKVNDVKDWLSQTTDNSKYCAWSPGLWGKESRLYIFSHQTDILVFKKCKEHIHCRPIFFCDWMKSNYFIEVSNICQTTTLKAIRYVNFLYWASFPVSFKSKFSLDSNTLLVQSTCFCKPRKNNVTRTTGCALICVHVYNKTNWTLQW